MTFIIVFLAGVSVLAFFLAFRAFARGLLCELNDRWPNQQRRRR